MSNEAFYRWPKTETVSAQSLTRRFVDLHLRLTVMEALKASYEDVLATVSDRVLQRSEDVIAGLRSQLAQITQLEWLTALSTTSLTLVEGAVRSLVVLPDQRALFAPGPFAILTRTTTPDDYAIIQTMAYDRMSGQLDFTVVTAVGLPGPFADWQVAALAGSTLAQMSLLDVGKAARDGAVEANRLAQIAAGSADADAEAAALNRQQTGADRTATGNDRAATLTLRDQTVAAAGSIDTTNFLKKDGSTASTGKQTLVAPAAGRASLNLPAGTDPSAPAEGDFWNAGSGVLRAFVAGAVHRIPFLGLAQSWGAVQTFLTGLVLSPVSADPASPVEGQRWTRTGLGFYGYINGAARRILDASMKATTAQAQAGADDATFMTPATVASAIAKLSPPGPTLDDFRTVVVQLAKLKGSAVGMAGGVADDFKDQSGVSVPFTETVQSLPAMTSNTLPSGHVVTTSGDYDASGFPAWKAFDQVVAVRGWASATATGWIARELPAAISVFAYVLGGAPSSTGNMPKNWTFEGWTGSAWVVLDTQVGAPAWSGGSELRQYAISVGSIGSYKKYRLNVSLTQGGSNVEVPELQFLQGASGDSVNAIYDAANNLVTNSNVASTEDLVAMTSNTAPSGQAATASAALAPQQPWMAYDKDSTSRWAAAGTSAQTLQRTSASARREGAYAITVHSDTTEAPPAFTRWGSNDGGTTKVALDTQTGLTWSAGQRRAFTISAANRGSYTTYGLSIPATGNSYMSVASLESLLDTTAALDLRSVAFPAQAVPTKGSVFALVKATTGTITANTNLLARLSRDGGTTYTTASLTKTGTLSTGYDIYEANGFDISGQPSGSSMKWNIQTVGATLGVAIDAVVAQWG